MKKIDLNVDVGEGFGFDSELLQIATSANVCCGAHAGDEELTRQTVEMCLEFGVRVGIHPGFPDRASMGRAELSPENEREYLDSVLAQIRTFEARYPTKYIKPHGALYNMTGKPLVEGWERAHGSIGPKSHYESGGYALSLVPGTGVLTIALRVTGLPLMGLPGTMHEEIARRSGFGFIREGFADRMYLPDGTLAPRWEPGSVLTEVSQVTEQALELAECVDSICIHGDTPDAVSLAAAVREALTCAGYDISADGD